MPWSSFARLASLSVHVEFLGPAFWSVPRRDSVRWCILPSAPLFLSEASRLVGLQELKVDYRFKDTFYEGPWLNQTLRELYGECLNPTFARERGGFPALELFSTSITMSRTPDLIGKAGLIANVMSQLSSIFGPGGRVEMDSWKTVVRGELYPQHEWDGYESYANCNDSFG